MELQGATGGRTVGGPGCWGSQASPERPCSWPHVTKCDLHFYLSLFYGGRFLCGNVPFPFALQILCVPRWNISPSSHLRMTSPHPLFAVEAGRRVGPPSRCARLACPNPVPRLPAASSCRSSAEAPVGPRCRPLQHLPRTPPGPRHRAPIPAPVRVSPSPPVPTGQRCSGSCDPLLVRRAAGMGGASRVGEGRRRPPGGPVHTRGPTQL